MNIDHNKQLYNELEKLYHSHINNGGTVDFSEKDYSYLIDDIEVIEVLYFKSETGDSDFANELREGLKTGKYSLMNDQEAYELMSVRLNNVNQNILSYNFKNK